MVSKKFVFYIKRKFFDEFHFYGSNIILDILFSQNKVPIQKYWKNNFFFFISSIQNTSWKKLIVQRHYFFQIIIPRRVKTYTEYTLSAKKFYFYKMIDVFLMRKPFVQTKHKSPFVQTNVVRHKHLVIGLFTTSLITTNSSSKTIIQKALRL